MTQLEIKNGLSSQLSQHLKGIKDNLEKSSAEVLYNFKYIEDLYKSGVLSLKHLRKIDYEANFRMLYGMDHCNLYCEVLSLHPDLKDKDVYAPAVFENWDAVLSTGINYYKEGHDNRLFQTARENIILREQEALFFIWIAKLWRDAGFSKYGLNAYIVQNNSASMFDLNRCAHFDLLPQKEQDEMEDGYKHIYKRKLSDFEIEARVRLMHAPLNITYWRHFTKKIIFGKEKFVSLGMYQCAYEIIEHSGSFDNIKSLKKGKYKDRGEAKRDIQLFTTQKIQDGWSEVPLDDSDQKINAKHLHFDTITFKDTVELSPDKFKAIGDAASFKFPQSYIKFLCTFYRQPLLSYDVGVAINENSYERFHKFIWPKEGDRPQEVEGKMFWPVADTKNGKVILLDDQGEIYIQGRKEVTLLFNSFIDFLQSLFDCSYIEPAPQYYAEKGDVDFFKGYLKSNYADNRLKNGRTILSFALDHPLLVKLLLEHGADPNNTTLHYKDTTDEVIDLLTEHGYHPSESMKRNQLNYDYIVKNWAYGHKFPSVPDTREKVEIKIPTREKRNDDAALISQIESTTRITIPDDVKDFLLNHAGQRPNKIWFKLGSQNGNHLRFDRFLEFDEMMDRINKYKEKIAKQGYGKKECGIAIGKTTSYETIYLDRNESSDALYIGLDSNWTISNHISIGLLHNGEDMMLQFVNSLKHEKEIFFGVAKAILENDVDYIKDLISKNWNPNYYLFPHESPLGLAMYLNNFELVDLFLDNGAEMSGERNQNPLASAMAKGTKEMVAYLIDRGVLEFDPSPEYHRMATDLIKVNGRDYLEEFLPRLQLYSS